DARDDLAFGLLECRDLRAEVGREILVAARIDQRVALLLQRLREADVRIAPSIAVAIVREQAAHLLVLRQRAPHRREHGDDVFEPPEEVIGPLEALIRLAAAREEPGLPRR